MRRFSLRQFMLGIAVFGLLLATLRYAVPWSARALFDLVLLLLAFSVLLAIYSQEPRRAFWTGFALFGWIMVAVTQFHVLFAETQNSMSSISSSKWSFHPLAQDNLPTTIAGRGLYRILRPALEIQPPSPPPPNLILNGAPRFVGVNNQKNAITQYPNGFINGAGLGPFYVVEEDFLAVADCWWILLSGALGGLAAHWLSGRRNKREADSVDATTPGS